MMKMMKQLVMMVNKMASEYKHFHNLCSHFRVLGWALHAGSILCLGRLCFCCRVSSTHLLQFVLGAMKSSQCQIVPVLYVDEA